MANDTRRLIEDVILGKTAIDSNTAKKEIKKVQEQVNELRDEQRYNENMRLRREKDHQNKLDKIEYNSNSKLSRLKEKIDILKRSPKLVEAEEHYDVGLNCLKAGLLEESIKEFKQAVECKPDFYNAYIGLSKSYLSQVIKTAGDMPLKGLMKDPLLAGMVKEIDENLIKAIKIIEGSMPYSYSYLLYRDLMIEFIFFLKKIDEWDLNSKWLNEYNKYYEQEFLSLLDDELLKNYSKTLPNRHGEDRVLSLLRKYLDVKKKEMQNKYTNLIIFEKEPIEVYLHKINEIEKWVLKNGVPVEGLSAKIKVLLKDEVTALINYEEALKQEISQKRMKKESEVKAQLINIAKSYLKNSSVRINASIPAEDGELGEQVIELSRLYKSRAEEKNGYLEAIILIMALLQSEWVTKGCFAEVTTCN